jgi:uncharacterized damage-inducible protein DinB
MTSTDLLLDALGRVHEVVHDAVDGLTPEELAYRVDGTSNSIEWLVWHLSRITDDHISDAAGTEQVWITGGWVDRFGLPFGPRATGYGHGGDDVAAVQVKSGELLTSYFDAVYEEARRFVEALTEADLPRIVDDSWDPPVTLAVRLVSVVSDCLQHAGQAHFMRGIVERR